MAAGDLVGDDLDTILDQYGAQSSTLGLLTEYLDGEKDSALNLNNLKKQLNCLAVFREDFMMKSAQSGTMVVPRPSAVWISNLPSICEALMRMLRNPKPSLFARLALEIPDPLSFT